jgi:hypothetical protein
MWKTYDLLESDKLNAVINLHKYQTEMKAWRDKNVKQRIFDVGDLVLLRSPRTESSRKLESKWDGSYVVIEKSRPGSYRLLDLQGRRTTFAIFTFQEVLKSGSLVSYKRAFVMEHRTANLLFKVRTLFLTGKARKSVSFLMRQILYIPKS